jgi:simple sugar transport system permease protein
MMMFIRGVIFAVTGGFSVFYEIQPIRLVPTLNSAFGNSTFRTSILWLILFVVVFTFILNRTAYGNRVQATGGDKRTAEALGVNWRRIKLINFILCSLLAGFSGIVNMGRFKTVEAVLCEGMELETIAVAVIGGNLLMGGYGSIVGTLIGSTLMGMMRSGLILAGAPAFWYRAFIGAILVPAVIINVSIHRKMLR